MSNIIPAGGYINEEAIVRSPIKGHYGALHSNNRVEYFGSLDTIRFLAFLLIFIHHTRPTSHPFVSDLQQAGWIGVDIFLCLSAFLLTRLLFFELKRNGQISLRKFFIRRILRIWPLYFTYLLFVLLMTAILDNFDQFHLRFITLITFTDNIATALDGYNPLLATSHLWTISYEEQIYLLLPFCVLFISKLSTKRRIILSVILVSIGLAARMVFLIKTKEHFQPAVWVLPLTHFESIIAGFLLARCYGQLLGKSFLFAIFSILTFGILWLFTNSEDNYQNVFFSYPVAAFFSLSIVTLAVTINSKPFIFSAVTRYLGRISYGLYVFHLFCLTLVYHSSPFDNYLIDNSAALLMCILFATLSYELLEKRFLELKNRYAVLRYW